MTNAAQPTPPGPIPNEVLGELLQHQSLVGLYMLQGARFRYANERMAEMLGYSLQELLDIPSFMELVVEEDRSLVAEKMRRRLAGESAAEEYVIRVRTKSGAIRHIEVHGAATPLDGARAIFGVAIDVTPQWALDDLLSIPEVALRHILDLSNDSIALHDIDSFAVVEANNKFYELHGYAPEEAGRIRIDDLGTNQAPYSKDELLPIIERVRGGEPRTFEWLTRHKSGRIFPVEVSLWRTTVKGRDRILAVVRDLTKQKALEDRLVRSQKLEVVGRLAAGIAHDFNNNLTTILGYADLLSRELEAGSEPGRYAAEIRDSAKRASAVSQRLLTFSRRELVKPVELELNAAISDLEKTFRRLIGENIELRVTPCIERCWIKADPGQLEQVLLNLVINARDAMPDGGTLAIETKRGMSAGAGPAADRTAREPFIQVSVTDTGTGMTQETQARLFEPFFTTKEEDKGTGLGLSTSREIVRQMGGEIKVWSEPGRGSRFEVHLPQALHATLSTHPKVHPAPRGGRETVLLVEDDDQIRDLAVRFLRMSGYKVIEACDGVEALELSERHSEAIDLLVTDVVMPRKGGWELAAELHASRPETKTLYMTGYVDNAFMSQRLGELGRSLVRKPFTLDDLGRSVREALGADSRDRSSESA
ncbi:MAG: PAS domain S-box protein [Nitrospirae bacterium]|nr:PAS domain S-box protein [Nitrospirota bacterium]